MIKFPILAVSALVFGLAAAPAAYAQPSPTPIPTPPPGATARCNDGTYCYNHDQNRACWNHGGIDQWFHAPSSQSRTVPNDYTSLPADTQVRPVRLTIAGVAG